jgi:hypothetical protein
MRSTGLRSPAGVQRARWWTFPTPQELPVFRVISPLPHSMRLGRHHRWTKRRDEGRLRPPPIATSAPPANWVRAPLRCERGHAIIVKHGRRTVRGLPKEVVVIFVEGLDDLLDVLNQMAPVLVLLSTTAILWWRSAHVAR